MVIFHVNVYQKVYGIWNGIWKYDGILCLSIFGILWLMFFLEILCFFWPHIFHNIPYIKTKYSIIFHNTMFYGIVYAIRELWFMYYYCYWSNWSYYTVAKLVQITPITIFSGVYKPTYSWRAPHCSHGGTPVAGSEKKILYIYNLYVYSFFGVPAFQKSLH